MVADYRKLLGVGEELLDTERCMSVYTALDKGNEDQGVNSFAISGYARRHREISLQDVNLRVIDQDITVGHTGCITEHTRTEQETRIRVVVCPEELAQRCGNCVLNIVDGEELMTELIERANNPIIL